MLAKHAQLARPAARRRSYIEYAARSPRRPATAEAAEPTQRGREQPKRSTAEGVRRVAAAPGTAAEAKPAKRNCKAAQDPVEKKTPREVFEYVIEQGKKEYQVQRYKGLGEMTAPQLWETTMDPERRTLLQVQARRHRRHAKRSSPR